MKRCLGCSALEGHDLCTRCGGPFDTSDRVERRALRALANEGLLRGSVVVVSSQLGTLGRQHGKGTT